ncbi:MAG: glutathione S-transferase family protein [Aquisalinus sp.]|nr:glutathione S-transferase family protein [Aquisalinus sp.]
MANDLTLVIGSKNLSSWSLRPWLVMKAFDISFNEVLIRLDQPESRAALKAHSPSGLVPCLRHGELAIWDSLAITEYLAELYPEKKLWPENPSARALARSMSAEMHSGFSNIRDTWPMEFAREGAQVWGGPGVHKDIGRLQYLWNEALEAYGTGEDTSFLFGEFSIADAMFAPVVSRLRTYGPVRVSTRIAAWLENIWNLPAMKEWGQGARHEVDKGWYKG